MTVNSRPQSIANAFLSIARANNYMVGFTGAATLRDLDEAEQVLITRETELHEGFISRSRSKRYDLAFALLNQTRLALLRTGATYFDGPIGEPTIFEDEPEPVEAVPCPTDQP